MKNKTQFQSIYVWISYLLSYQSSIYFHFSIIIFEEIVSTEKYQLVLIKKKLCPTFNRRKPRCSITEITKELFRYYPLIGFSFLIDLFTEIWFTYTPHSIGHLGNIHKGRPLFSRIFEATYPPFFIQKIKFCMEQQNYLPP